MVTSTHLESSGLAPPKWHQTYNEDCVFQKKESLNLLNTLENVTVIGYMNWDHKKDTSPFLTNKSHQILPRHCLLQKCQDIILHAIFLSYQPSLLVLGNKQRNTNLFLPPFSLSLMSKMQRISLIIWCLLICYRWLLGSLYKYLCRSQYSQRTLFLVVYPTRGGGSVHINPTQESRSSSNTLYNNKRQRVATRKTPTEKIKKAAARRFQQKIQRIAARRPSPQSFHL